MKPALLVVNAGSSSLKFALYAISTAPNLLEVVAGQFEKLSAQPVVTITDQHGQLLLTESYDVTAGTEPVTTAMIRLLTWLSKAMPEYSLQVVGHRIVHGGEQFTAPVVITETVLQQLMQLIPLAPLHQPHNLVGIQLIAEQYPSLMQVACFDTAFHVTQSPLAQAYALPEQIASVTLKRYGFHGLSYEYIAQILPEYVPESLANGKVIVAHLGYGASLCAMKNRRSIATTMGFSALEGLMMGTRCGSIDPGILLYLLNNGMTVTELTDLLYYRSGLLGVSGISGDMRVLLASDQPAAAQAIALFVYRIQREIGSLVAALHGLDLLVFTAGIGEHAAAIRAQIVQQTAWLGIALDEAANQQAATVISRADSAVKVLVLPTNEALIIAQQTLQLWHNAGSGHLV